MKFAPYSASRLAVYEQCPRKFRYKYVDKIEVPFEPSLPLTRGKIIHHFLEFHEKLTLKESIAKMKLDKQITESPFYTKEVVKDCIVIYQNFTKTDFAKELFAQLELGTELHLGLNYKLEPCSYKGDEVLFRGMIDRVSVEKQEDLVYIIDWKSGKDKSQGAYKQTPDQLMHYGSWYFSKFPVDTIKLLYVFVEHNTKLEYTLHRTKVDDYKKALLRPIIRAERDDEFIINPTPLCDFCDFRFLCSDEEALKGEVA